MRRVKFVNVPLTRWLVVELVRDAAGTESFAQLSEHERYAQAVAALVSARARVDGRQVLLFVDVALAERTGG
jgi:hypothetical protein